jgi:methylamine dehydrogenase accessory protein MauD
MEAMEGWWAASYVVLWALVAVLCVTVVALARQIGTLHLRLGPRGALELDDEGPPLGARLDPQPVADLAGHTITVARRGEAQLLLFVSPGCGVCEQVLPVANALTHDRDPAPYVVSDAGTRETERMLGGTRIGAPELPAPTLASALEVPGTPYAIVLDEQGTVRAKGTVNNMEQIEGLARTAERRAREVLAA